MKKRMLGTFLAFTMVFTSAVPAFAATGEEVYDKVDLKVYSGNMKTPAVSVVANSNYKVTAKVENDAVDQSSVTLDLTMKNVGGLDVDGERHADFTLNTGLEPQTRYLSGYMPALKDFKGVDIEASVNGNAFAYDVEGEWKNGTGEWTATPDDVADVRAAWQVLTSYVDTTTYDEDDSQVVVANGSYMQIGSEKLYFEQDGDLVLNDLNDKDSLFQQIKDYVALDTEYVYEDQIVLYVAEDSILRVGASEAKLMEGTSIKINGLDSEMMDKDPLAQLREAANKDAATKELVVSALDIVNTVIAGMNGEDVTVEIETDDYAKAKKAAEKLNLKVISNGYTALRVVADKDYVVTVDLLNDVVNQKSVTLDLTMNNVGGLDVNGTRHADFTFNTGLADQERVLSDYMPGIKSLAKAELEASVNGKEFDYTLEGKYEDGTGKWVAKPGKVEDVRAAWVELTNHVSTPAPEANDDSYAVVANTSYLQVGNEVLKFEEGTNNLKLDNLNNKGIFQTIKEAVFLGKADTTEGQVVAYVGAGSELKVGGSKAVLNDGTKIVIDGANAEFDGMLKKMQNAANAGKDGAADMTLLIQSALDIANAVIVGAQGQTITIDIVTDDFVAKQEAADEAIEELEQIVIPEIKPDVEITEDDAKAIEDARKKVDAAQEAYSNLTEEQKEELGYKVPEQIAKAEAAVSKAETAKAEAEAKIAKDKADAEIKAEQDKAQDAVNKAETEKNEAVTKAEEAKAAAEAAAKEAEAKAEEAAKAEAEKQAAEEAKAAADKAAEEAKKAAEEAEAKVEAADKVKEEAVEAAKAEEAKKTEEAKAAATKAETAQKEAEAKAEAAQKAQAEAVVKQEAAEKAQKEAEAKVEAAATAQTNVAAAEKALNVIDKKVTAPKATAAAKKISTSWKAVEGADGYRVQIVKNGKVVKTYYTTETSYAATKLNSGVAYTVKVTPYATYGEKKYFGESVSKTAITKPVKAVVKVKSYKKYIKVTSAKKNCTGYEVVVASNKKFNKNVKKYTVKSATLAKKIQKSSLKKGKNYIKVRAYTKSGKTVKYGAWSAVKTVTK